MGVRVARNWRPLGVYKCPPLTLLLGDRTILQLLEGREALGLFVGDRCLRHRCPGEDPLPQDFDLLVAQLVSRRHEGLGRVRDKPPQPAAAQARASHGCASFASQQDLVPSPQVKSGLLDGSTVTDLAVFLEDRISLLR